MGRSDRIKNCLPQYSGRFLSLAQNRHACPWGLLSVWRGGGFERQSSGGIASASTDAVDHYGDSHGGPDDGGPERFARLRGLYVLLLREAGDNSAASLSSQAGSASDAALFTEAGAASAGAD